MRILGLALLLLSSVGAARPADALAPPPSPVPTATVIPPTQTPVVITATPHPTATAGPILVTPTPSPGGGGEGGAQLCLPLAPCLDLGALIRAFWDTVWGMITGAVGGVVHLILSILGTVGRAIYDATLGAMVATVEKTEDPTHVAGLGTLQGAFAQPARDLFVFLVILGITVFAVPAFVALRSTQLALFLFGAAVCSAAIGNLPLFMHAGFGAILDLSDRIGRNGADADAIRSMITWQGFMHEAGIVPLLTAIAVALLIIIFFIAAVVREFGIFLLNAFYVVAPLAIAFGAFPPTRGVAFRWFAGFVDLALWGVAFQLMIKLYVVSFASAAASGDLGLMIAALGGAIAVASAPMLLHVLTGSALQAGGGAVKAVVGVGLGALARTSAG